MITAAAPLVAASEKKRIANRLNARRSTGPKTPEGKARSAQNARKFGIFCKDLLVPGESQEDLDALKREMLRGLNPRTTLELQLVEQIVADEWRIKRIRAAERSAYERLHTEDRRRVRKGSDERRSELSLEMRDYRKMFATEIKENRIPQHAAERMSEITAMLAQLDAVTLPAPDPGMALERLMQTSPDLEKLWKHEQRLRNSVHRCMKELRQLRKEGVDELSEMAAGMLDEESQADQANVKNEPTDAASEGEPMSCATSESIPAGPGLMAQVESRSESEHKPASIPAAVIKSAA